MFIIKKNYYLYIENTKSIDLNYLKKNRKIIIIYRNKNLIENYANLYKFRNMCALKGFKFYVANNLKLANYCKADGLYISSYNKKIYLNYNKNIVGSAHILKKLMKKLNKAVVILFYPVCFVHLIKTKKTI